MRSVAALALTSTMTAFPALSKWVKAADLLLDLFPGFLGMRFLRAQQGFGGRRNILLTHQAFADQEAARAGLGHARKVGGGLEAAFADQHAVGGHKFRELLRDAEVGDESLEVA